MEDESDGENTSDNTSNESDNENDRVTNQSSSSPIKIRPLSDHNTDKFDDEIMNRVVSSSMYSPKRDSVESKGACSDKRKRT